MIGKSRKIAILHPFIYRYARGIERYTINLANALERNGVDVDIVTWKSKDPVVWGENTDNVRIFPVPVARYYSAVSVVPLYIKHLLRIRYDLVIIHFADYGESAALNAMKCIGRSIPLSIVLHFPYSQVPHRYHTLKSKGLFARAQSVVAVSKFVAEEAEIFTNSTPIVISHGVDVDRYTPNPSARVRILSLLCFPESSRLILTVSALEERKGVQYVLSAMPDLLMRYPDIHYLVVGDGPYEHELRALSATLNIEKHVHFFGARTDTEIFYQAAELMLILSRGEASSMVSLESLSCETPVISSNHRPFDELIQKEWGLRIDEENIQEISDTITALLENTEQRISMGKSGRQHILSEHTWDGIAKKYITQVLK